MLTRKQHEHQDSHIYHEIDKWTILSITTRNISKSKQSLKGEHYKAHRLLHDITEDEQQADSHI